MKKRNLFEEVSEHINKKHITLIIGARQVGKTTLLNQLKDQLIREKKKVFYFTLENPGILELLNIHPDKLYDLITPIPKNEKGIVIIDEIQYLDNPSNFLKYHYDLNSDQIKLVVSGSSSFYIDQKFSDSLAGRKRIFEMPTMSFEEFLFFKEFEEPVKYINSGKLPLIYKSQLYKLLNEYLLFGGYPDVVLEDSIEEKQAILKEIGQAYVKKDAIESKIKYTDLYLQLMKIVSNQTGSLFNANNVGKTLKIQSTTIEAYITLMMKSFHITKVKPFYRNISKEIRKMPKLYFNDLGLRNYFINNFSPIAIREDRGNLFENYIFRRLLDKYDSDEIKFWRTQKKQEVDFVISSKNAVEVKFDKSAFRRTKYNSFKEKYPDITLNLIHFENALEFNL